MDDQEPVFPDYMAGYLAHFITGCNESRQADQARVVHQSRDLGTTTQVFRSIVGRESQILADAAAEVLSINDCASSAVVKQASFQCMTECCLSCSSQARQQHGDNSLSEPAL